MPGAVASCTLAMLVCSHGSHAERGQLPGGSISRWYQRTLPRAAARTGSNGRLPAPTAVCVPLPPVLFPSLMWSESIRSGYLPISPAMSALAIQAQ